MRRGATAPLTDLPASPGWDFGGFAYGLEPLVLPAVTEPDALRDRAGPVPPARGYAETCLRIREYSDGSAPATERCGTAEELFWFRWITGHQVCFVIWRLMGQLLDDVDRCRTRAAAALEPMCRYIDGYSAMLLYTGSCPQELYHLLIRPSMALRHRAFSGSWAPDYAKVRELFRGRPPAPMSNGDAGELLDCLKLHNLVHDGVAAKLVPGGRSLLSQAGGGRLNRDVVGMIYDTYFMTLRLPVTRHQVVGQLLRRLVAIAQDIAANGLYAADDDRGALSNQFHTAEVIKFEKGLLEILFEVARFACGIAPPEYGQAPDDGLRATLEATGP
jgi:hypothetical protein